MVASKSHTLAAQHSTAQRLLESAFSPARLLWLTLIVVSFVRGARAATDCEEGEGVGWGMRQCSTA